MKIKKENTTIAGHTYDYELSDGTLLHEKEWNGQSYIVKENNTERKYTPVFRYQDENIDISEIEDDSDEWDNALEVLRFDVF